jgi:hypothetical protein
MNEWLFSTCHRCIYHQSGVLVTHFTPSCSNDACPDTAAWMAVLSRIDPVLLSVTTSLHIDFLRKPALGSRFDRRNILDQIGSRSGTDGVMRFNTRIQFLIPLIFIAYLHWLYASRPWLTLLSVRKASRTWWRRQTSPTAYHRLLVMPHRPNYNALVVAVFTPNDSNARADLLMPCF